MPGVVSNRVGCQCAKCFLFVSASCKLPRRATLVTSFPCLSSDLNLATFRENGLFDKDRMNSDMKKDEGLLYCHTTPATISTLTSYFFVACTRSLEKALDSEAGEAKVALTAAT